MSFVRKRYFGWWSRYNYITSAAFSCGYSICILVIFFCLQYPKSGSIGLGLQNWRGNTIAFDNLDSAGVGGAAKLLAKGETFGPPAGSWH